MMTLSSQFGIKAASHFLPAYKPVAEWVQQQQLPREVLRLLHENGMRYFHHAGDSSVEHLASGALRELMNDHPIDPGSVDLLVFVHSLQTSSPPAPASLAARLSASFGLHRAGSFALSGQNCASLLAALRLISSLMRADHSLQRVILVSADRACGERYRNFGAFSFESDGACALLIDRHHPFNRAIAFAGHVDGRHHAGFRRSGARAHEYRALYGLIAHRLIHRTVQASGLRLHEFRHLLPINVDRHVFERLAQGLQMPSEWVHTANTAQHGHVMCSDVVINLMDLLSLRPRGSASNLLFFMSGNNGSFATMALGNCHSFQ